MFCLRLTMFKFMTYKSHGFISQALPFFSCNVEKLDGAWGRGYIIELICWLQGKEVYQSTHVTFQDLEPGHNYYFQMQADISGRLSILTDVYSTRTYEIGAMYTCSYVNELGKGRVSNDLVKVVMIVLIPSSNLQILK